MKTESIAEGGYMKNLLKKNQIIITALAIMIAIAGYLNLTKDTLSGEKSKLDEKLTQAQEYESYSEEAMLAENESANSSFEISDEDSLNADTYEVTSTGSGEMVATDVSKELSTEQLSTEQLNAEQLNAEQDDVTSPGEAVLASTTLSSDYFTSAKLKREQTRSKNKSMLMDLLADSTATEEQRNLAFGKIVALAETAEIENATELLLEAKGFDGAVVSIVDNSVDVVVNASSVTDRQIAQIEDIVVRKTGMGAENIVVSAVVTQD